MPRSKSRSKKKLCNNVGGGAPKISLRPSENNCSAYRDLLFVWFADKAIKYITGRNIYDINNSNFKDIFSEIKKFFDSHFRKEEVQAPLVGNDVQKPHIRDMFSKRLIEYALGDALKEVVQEEELKFTGLAVEFIKYTRGFMPKACMEKKDLKVDKTVLALMDIGILLTYVGKIARKKDREYLYLAIDWEPLLSEFLEPWRRVQDDAKRIAYAVLVRGEGSIRTALVGMAAAVANALGYLRGLSAVRGEFVRIAVAGNKTMLKSVDVFDLLDLALIIQQYGLASPLFKLTRGYPADPTARRFVDMVAEAVLRYQRHRDLRELYRVVRAAASPGVNEAGRSTYKNWDQIINQIIRGPLASR